MLSVERVSNFLDDREEAVVTTQQPEKKLLTKDVDKGTDELEDMKEAVVAIRRKGLYKFEDEFKVSTGWFNHDNEFKKSTIDPELYKTIFEKYIKGQDTELYKKFF